MSFHRTLGFPGKFFADQEQYHNLANHAEKIKALSELSDNGIRGAITKTIDNISKSGQYSVDEIEIISDIFRSKNLSDFLQDGLKNHMAKCVQMEFVGGKSNPTDIECLDDAIRTAVSKIRSVQDEHPLEKKSDLMNYVLYVKDTDLIDYVEFKDLLEGKELLGLNDLSDEESIQHYEKSKLYTVETDLGVFLNDSSKQSIRVFCGENRHIKNPEIMISHFRKIMNIHPAHQKIWEDEIKREVNFRSKISFLEEDLKRKKHKGRSFNIMISGMKEHGKDEVCKILKKEFGLDIKGSSMFACEQFMYEDLKDKYGYTSIGECFADRTTKRQEWYEGIKKFNNPLHRMGEMIFNKYDGYNGIRDDEEFEALKENDLIDINIWIDRSQFKEPESKQSMKLDDTCSDIILDNNASIDMLRERVIEVYQTLIEPNLENKQNFNLDASA